MTNTPHGHHIPGSPHEDFEGRKQRCGGIRWCYYCKEEAISFWENMPSMDDVTGALLRAIEDFRAQMHKFSSEIQETLERCYNFSRRTTDERSIG